MAITFFQQRKKQQKMIFIFGGVILIILLVVWQGFLKKDEPGSSQLEPLSSGFIRPVRINFEALQNPALEELQAFDRIPAFEKEVGQENPFLK